MKYWLKILLLILIAAPIAAQQGGCPLRSGHFIENSGQWDKSVKFFAKAAGMNVWFTDNAAVFDFYKPEISKTVLEHFSQPSNPDVSGHIVRMNFSEQNNDINKASNQQSKYKPLNPFSSNYNYFTSKQNQLNANSYNAGSFEELIYENVYPGIDIRFYFDGLNLRYDFIVSAGSDKDLIQLSFVGQNSLTINSDNSVSIGTNIGDVKMLGLKAFIADSDEYYSKAHTTETFLEIPCSFLLAGDDRIAFQFDDSGDNSICGSSSSNLIIDPLIWATYLGGSSSEKGDFYEPVNITSDADGFLYICGTTYSSDFPQTIGAYTSQFASTHSMFITKLNPAGTQIVFSSVISSGSPRPYSICLDLQKNIYVTGFVSNN